MKIESNSSFHFQLVIDHCEIAIKSIELQLVRVETCGCAEGYARDGELNTIKLIPQILYWLNHRNGYQLQQTFPYNNATHNILRGAKLWHVF